MGGRSKCSAANGPGVRQRTPATTEPDPPPRGSGEEGPVGIEGADGYGCQVTVQAFVKLKLDAPVSLALQLLPGSRNQYW